VEDLRLRPIKRRERSFEYALRDELAKMGVMFVKLKPTITGFPDRLAIGACNMKLIETKAEDGEPSEGQRVLHEKILRDQGVEVIVVKRNVRVAALQIYSALRER